MNDEEDTMSEPLSAEELEELRAQDERQIDALRAALAQHSDATDVSNSDVQLLRLSAMKRFAGEGEPCGALFVVRCGDPDTWGSQP